MIEPFLVKIISLILKKALVSKAVTTLINVIDVYMTIESINDTLKLIGTKNDCKGLGLYAVKATSEVLSEGVFNQIINHGNDSFQLEKTKSGLFIINSYTPTFKIPKDSDIVTIYNNFTELCQNSDINTNLFREVKNDQFGHTVSNKFKRIDDT